MTSLNRLVALSFGLGAAALVFFSPQIAHAGIESCGNIDVRADATCTVETSGGCTAKCTPISFEAACAADLQASCSGGCNVTIDAACTASCTGGCQADCALDPGSLDCSANCQGSCEMDCSGKCSSAANQSQCEASCKATCSGSCDARCSGTPPSASCEAKCNASCQGSCQARANLDCQINCQTRGFVQCQADLKGGCEAQCTAPSGALFCDGQFVDTGNHLQDCIDALNGFLHVHVQASGSADCEGNTCYAEGSVSCASAPGTLETPARTSGLWLLGVVGAMTAARFRRRKTRYSATPLR